MKKIMLILAALLSFSNAVFGLESDTNDAVCRIIKSSNNVLSQMPNKKLGEREGSYYGYDDLSYIPYYENDGFTVKFEIDNKVYNTEQQVMDDSEVTIAVSRYQMPGSQGELILASMLLTTIDLPPEATQTYYYNEGETHLVYSYKKGRLKYLGEFDLDAVNRNEYDQLAKSIVFSKKDIDYLSDLTVIDEGDKITIYSQSKYGKAHSINSFDL
jgi:hypothetical protein